MQRQTLIATWCSRIIEGGWLLALALVPSYFNLLSSRHFEPDKATTLRAIVLIMAAAGIVYGLERMGRGPLVRETPSASGVGESPGFWRRFTAFPMLIPVLVYILIFLVATAFSIAPGASFWGSYQRLQGTYTNLSYIALGVLIILNLRTREQVERLITVLILGSLPAIGYGLIQHFQVDPLPWRGDVVSRVASTMGNSIFVAAYLIMVLPFALYRTVTTFYEARRAPLVGSGADVGWIAAYTAAIIGALMIVFAAMEFGAVVRTSDLRYWWVYPGALIVALGLFLLPTLHLHIGERTGRVTLWPGAITLLYVALVGIVFAAGQASGDQLVQPSPGRGGTEWPFWMLSGTVLVLIAYALFFTLPRAAAPSRLSLILQGAGGLMVSGLLLLTIFFTQSRGPWIGGAVGLFVFFTLLLFLALRRARAVGSPRAGLWRALLIGEVLLVVSLAVFVALFNYSNAPFFEQLRQVPYIGRMGRLLDVSPGSTGDVRVKIWFGDDKAGGAVALITAEPLHTLIGWGPESMFVAYNRFYPPSLANIESRGASPDRSHEAYLDELVNKGVLGLISYLFVLFSFFTLAWRLISRIEDWRTQVLVLACIATVTAHAVEGLTGIPIVASLMLLWVTIALTITTGMLMGQYSLAPLPVASAPLPAPPAPEPVPSKGTSGPARGNRRRQSAAARGAAQNRAPIRRAGRDSNSATLAIYLIIVLIALLAVWSLNIDNVYADMRFQQGQNYTEGPNAELDQQIIGAYYYLDAIRMEPGQDFYYLNLGRSLMSIVDIRRQASDIQLGAVKPDARVEDLLRLSDPSALQEFVLQHSPLELMSYAYVVLNRAHELSPLNKDHFANLARMYNFWYTRISHDPEQLKNAIEWYRRGHEIAPQDVTILDEYASAVALQGSAAAANGDTTGATALFDQAEHLLAESHRLDPLYPDTNLRTADLLRLRGRSAQAVDQYVALLAKNPHALDAQITTIMESLHGQNELLRRLRDSYAVALANTPNDVVLTSLVGMLSARGGDLPAAAAAFASATKLQPQNLEAHQNYTLVLSDMHQYQQAAAEAQTLLTLAQQQQASEQDIAALTALLNYLQSLAAQGQ